LEKMVLLENPEQQEKTVKQADPEMQVIKVTVEIQVHKEQLVNPESKEHKEPLDPTD